MCIKKRENTQVLNHEINEDAIITNKILSWLGTTLAYRLCRLFTQVSWPWWQGPFKTRDGTKLAWLQGCPVLPFEKGGPAPHTLSSQPPPERNSCLLASDPGLTPAPPSAQLPWLSTKAFRPPTASSHCWPQHQTSPVLQERILTSFLLPTSASRWRLSPGKPALQALHPSWELSTH